jgi:hypothetical protein
MQGSFGAKLLLQSPWWGVPLPIRVNFVSD